MEASPPPDEELCASQILWSPDLDARWRLLRRHITPFERDRAAYHSAKYQKPVFVFMSPFAWRRLVEKQGSHRAVDLMLVLGFAPAPDERSSIAEWIERGAGASGDETRATGVRFWVLNQDDTGLSVSGSPLSHPHPLNAPSNTQATTTTVAVAPTTTTGGGGGGGGGGMPSTPLATATAARIRNLEAEVRDLTRQLRLLKSRDALANPNSHSNDPNPLDASNTVCHGGVNGGVQNGVFTSSTASSSQSHHYHGGSSNHHHHHPQQQQQTQSASQQQSPLQLHLSPSQSQPLQQSMETPQPQIVVRSDCPLVASTNCHSLVCLPVNYLDPDCAPYVVSLGAHSGRTLLACTIVEHRYVIFVAPPHPRGSLAVVLLCTRDGTLRPYARAVWLEYRAQDPPNTLTHHAVNQLLQEIPLPSSATAADANPSEVEQAKSESAFEDDNTFCDTDTALSTSDHGLEFEPRLPLTKEMLELIPNGVITAGLRPPRTAATSHAHANDGTLSAAGSESLSGCPERGDAKRGGRATHTEHSGSTAASVRSAESATHSAHTPAAIMAGRGWVRRAQRTPATPTGKKGMRRHASFSANMEEGGCGGSTHTQQPPSP